mmetsp:Transcript_10021/g.13749  ORF Transcript_10021/g.13749 Transcript_10021/m.13749 type:complete len:376 (+) Transcript_10021:1361-2488(+)
MQISSENSPDVIERLAIKKQVEYYFSDNTLDFERQMKIATEVDHGFVGIDLLMTFPLLAKLTTDASKVVEAVKDSVHLRLSEDNKKIQRIVPYRVDTYHLYRNDSNYYRSKRTSISGYGYYRTNGGNVQPFVHAIQNSRFLTAKKLLKEVISSVDRDCAEMDVLKLNKNFNFEVLLRFQSLFSLMGQGHESFVLLLWATFPKLLLLHQDLITEPAPHEKTLINWEFYCRELLLEIRRLGGSEVEKVIELPGMDFSSPSGDLRQVNGVNAEEALLLAKALCNSNIIVVHDHVNTVWIKDKALSGPAHINSRRTTYCLSSSMPGRVREMERLREMTEKERAYWKLLRWKDRRPALLVAARFREGRYFGALALVARFL